MDKKIKKILVTGGAGFIGSHFVRQALQEGWRVIVVDKLSYAGDLQRLREAGARGYKFYKADIRNSKKLDFIFKKERPQALIHFAAETHVDRSIADASIFMETNIIGTKNLLDLSRKYKFKKFLQISTDEVYGEIAGGSFKEDYPLRPNSPYAASKAAADLVIKSYFRTYGFPVLIARPCNNYGPWQYPEKFIPVIIYKALRGEKVPIYARGLNIREWLYVRDCAEAVSLILRKGEPGEIYNLGSGHEERNIGLAKKILRILGRKSTLLEFVKDRPGHDYRYSLDSSKIRKLGWRPKKSFGKGLEETVHWYKENLNWLEQKAGYLNKYWKKVYRKP